MKCRIKTYPTPHILIPLAPNVVQNFNPPPGSYILHRHFQYQLPPRTGLIHTAIDTSSINFPQGQALYTLHRYFKYCVSTLHTRTPLSIKILHYNASCINAIKRHNKTSSTKGLLGFITLDQVGKVKTESVSIDYLYK